jgi:hypothetical protein
MRIALAAHSKKGMVVYLREATSWSGRLPHWYTTEGLAERAVWR